MRESAFQFGVAIYGLWISGILLALYLMLTNKPTAQPVIAIVLFGSIGIGLAFVGFVIAGPEGAL